MRAPIFVALLVVAGQAGGLCNGQANLNWRETFPRVADSLEANHNIILAARFELEMRRVGGPRPSAIVGILDDRALLQDHAKLRRMWIKQAFAACENHVVPCSEVLTLFDRLRAMSDPTAPIFSPRDREGLEGVAAREALSPERTEQLYRRALLTGGARDGAVFVLAEEAAFRVYDERIQNLYPAADRFLNSDGKGDKSRVIAARRVALASTGPDAVSHLIALVREAAAWDVDTWSLPDPRRYEAYNAGKTTHRYLVSAALGELRRRDLPGTREGLEQAMEFFDKDHILAAHPNGGGVLRNALRDSRWLKDEFSTDLAEAVGDFGDRKLEREVLGGRCLWDMVNEAEKAMVARKMLTPGQMVTGEVQ